MKEKLNAAIEVLMSQLEDQEKQMAETKKMINALLVRTGNKPRFDHVEDEKVGGPLRRDQFYTKPLATAVTEYLEQRHEACTAEEILDGLKKGGFDFRALGWQDKLRLRNLAISLAKNTQTFHKLPNGTLGLLGWYDKTAITPAADRPNAKPRKKKPRKKIKLKKRVKSAQAASAETPAEQEEKGEQKAASQNEGGAP